MCEEVCVCVREGASERVYESKTKCRSSRGSAAAVPVGEQLLTSQVKRRSSASFSFLLTRHAASSSPPCISLKSIHALHLHSPP